MALTITAIQGLQAYFRKVMDRANHHANNVNEVVLTLVGGVVWRSTDDFQVRTYDGDTANILWMYVNDKRYCFKFDHNSGCILVCEDSHNGKEIMRFNNQTTTKSVKDFFASL